MLGNYYSVAQSRELPDASFNLESFDVSAEFEALLTGKNFVGLADGAAIKLAKSLPFDVASAFKAGFSSATPYNVVGSVAIPHLTLESVSYRFGITENATQSAVLKGDNVMYNLGSCFIEEFVGTNTADQAVLLANPAGVYKVDTVAGDRYALSVALGSGKRLSTRRPRCQVGVPSGRQVAASTSATTTPARCVATVTIWRLTWAYAPALCSSHA